MSEAEEKQPDKVQEQARQIDRELDSLQQQINAVDQEMTPDRLNGIKQKSEQAAAELEQPEQG